MTESSNQTDPYREPVRETLFDAQRVLKDVVIANAAGVTRQFVGLVVGGIKGLSLRAFLSMWEHGPRELTDRLARLLERVNPRYRITRREVDAAADPVARACCGIRDNVDFFEAVRGSHADGVVDAAELANIERRGAAMKEQIDQVVAGCRAAARRGKTSGKR